MPGGEAALRVGDGCEAEAAAEAVSAIVSVARASCGVAILVPVKGG